MEKREYFSTLFILPMTQQLYKSLFSTISFSGDVKGKALGAGCVLGKRDLLMLMFTVAPQLFKGFGGFKHSL